MVSSFGFLRTDISESSRWPRKPHGRDRGCSRVRGWIAGWKWREAFWVCTKVRRPVCTKFLCGGSKLMGLIRLDGVHWGKVGITTDFVISWNIEAFKRIQHTNFSSAICYRKGFASVSGHLGGWAGFNCNLSLIVRHLLWNSWPFRTIHSGFLCQIPRRKLAIPVSFWVVWWGVGFIPSTPEDLKIGKKWFSSPFQAHFLKQRGNLDKDILVIKANSLQPSMYLDFSVWGWLFPNLCFTTDFSNLDVPNFSPPGFWDEPQTHFNWEM